MASTDTRRDPLEELAELLAGFSHEQQEAAVSYSTVYITAYKDGYRDGSRKAAEAAAEACRF